MADKDAVWDGRPFTVVARKAMWRGGRNWTAGSHDFNSKEALASIGDEAAIGKMLATLRLYSADFEIKPAELKKDEPKK
jgi:hypothetical protein